MSEMFPVPSSGILAMRDYRQTPILETTNLGHRLRGLRAVDEFNSYSAERRSPASSAPTALGRRRSSTSSQTLPTPTAVRFCSTARYTRQEDLSDQKMHRPHVPEHSAS